MADDITFKTIKMRQTKGEEIWLRQKTDDGNAVIRAYRASNTEPVFANMTIFSFDPTGRFIERYHAETAELIDSQWQLKTVRIISPGAEARIQEMMTLTTNLTRDQVRQSLTPPETISFYDLPDWAERLTASGLDANRYIQQYRSLLARPFLLMAMILVAASVSLRFSRFGVSGRAIVAGIASGFALYIVNKVSTDLGAVGTFSTGFAAFFPPVLAGLLGILVLLNQEDG
jgi:lipopolysaccharide export system permease protein